MKYSIIIQKLADTHFKKLQKSGDKARKIRSHYFCLGTLLKLKNNPKINL